MQVFLNGQYCSFTKISYFSALQNQTWQQGAAKGRVCVIGAMPRLTAGALNSMCVQPSLVLEKHSKQQHYMPMAISFGARRERAGITQKVAPMLCEFSLAVEPLFWWQCTSNRRHDSHLCRSPGDADDMQACHSEFSNWWSILLTFPNLILRILSSCEYARGLSLFFQ
jgi:hypothetical protein